MSSLAVIVLAAGLGKRTGVRTPKVLLPLCGRTLLETVLDTTAALAPQRTIVVVHHGREAVATSSSGRAGVECVDQGEPRGTGHAVRVAFAHLTGFTGDVLVVYGDMPLLRADTLAVLREARGAAAAAILTAFPDDPSGLGRILRDAEGGIAAIREERDCDPDQLAIDEINVGVYCFAADRLGPALARLSDDNAQRELYLTDTVGHLLDDGHAVETVVATDPDEALGINSLAQLATARSVMQERILLDHLAAGVVIEDPATTFIDWGVTIGRDTRILPCTVIRRGVRIGSGCEVGPFSHLRPGTVLDDTAEIGNFVEVKQSRIGIGAKAKHLAYLGDSQVGRGANIGAGTITANYDGRSKHRTEIGDGAFVGSGTVLVAPARMAAGSKTGAGAVVTRNTEIGEGEVYVGVPARRLGATGDERQSR
jgi:bifunctional UDP-N-acetylglucosamine pyrophosphorylase/glucosamine-1-phosphate N-acetyltransferase